MSLFNKIITITFLFLTGCGVFIKQPQFKKQDGPVIELSGTSFKYWDGNLNFVKQNLFIESDVIIICIPGIGGHTGTYNSLQKYFSEQKISTVGIDIRGFGHWTGRKGDMKNIGLHIRDIDQVVDYYRNNYPGKKILLLSESLGSSFCIWYSACYPEKTDGLIITSLITRKGEGNIKLKTVLNFTLAYYFCPARPVLLQSDPSKYSDDPDFMKWMTVSDTLITRKISPRYLIQSNRIIKRSYGYLCNYEKPTLLLQGGKDFMSDKKDIIKILDHCRLGNIQYKYFQEDYHSLVNDLNRTEVYDTMIEWINNNYKPGKLK